MKINTAEFVISNSEVDKCPKDRLPEYAFIGRSNVGKSSLINMLTNHKNLAKTSSKPGKTQLINHFKINSNWFLVDLPGYGYAQVDLKTKSHWNNLLSSYLQTRPNLKGMVLIMDSRRGMTDLDQQMIEWFSPTGRPIHVLLTKCDKLNQSESRLALKKLQEKLKELNPHGPYTVQLFSSTKRIGLVEADAMVSNWLGIEASAAHTSNENRISKNLKPQLSS